VQLCKKEYYHIEELPEILKGHIDGHTVPINPKTGVWAGGMKGTTVENFHVNAGGWECGHQDMGVSDEMVPENIRAAFKLKRGK
jgi:hypothetical protein